MHLRSSPSPSKGANGFPYMQFANTLDRLAHVGHPGWARMARGCTSGQALSGGATLAAGSWAVMLAIFASAYLLAYFVRRLWL